MKAAELLVSAIENRGKSHKEVAAHLKRKPATFSKNIKQNALRAQELVDAAEYLGYTVMLVDKDSSEAMELVSRGTGPRVRKQIGGEVYDTARAKFICKTEAKDGWWLELFQNESGKFFAAHYTEWDGVENFITLCPDDEARKLTELNVG